MARSGGPFGPDARRVDGRGRLVTLALLAIVLVLGGVVAFALARPSSADEVGAAVDSADVDETAGTPTVTEVAGETARRPPTI